MSAEERADLSTADGEDRQPAWGRLKPAPSPGLGGAAALTWADSAIQGTWPRLEIFLVIRTRWKLVVGVLLVSSR